MRHQLGDDGSGCGGCGRGNDNGAKLPKQQQQHHQRKPFTYLTLTITIVAIALLSFHHTYVEASLDGLPTDIDAFCPKGELLSLGSLY
jgi:hypothetical protein